MFETLPEMLPAKQFIAMLTVFAVFSVMMIRKNAPTEVLFSGALGVFVFLGIISPERAWESFAHPAVIAIAGLLVVTAALRTCGVLDYAGSKLLGGVTTETNALLRISVVAIIGSAFILNTAIVAMLMPIAIAWCRRNNISPSRILMPLSFLAILGGTCSLLGTSTNLVVDGEFKEFRKEVAAVVAARQEDNESTGTDVGEVGNTGDSRIANLPMDWLENCLANGQFDSMELTEISRIGIPCAILGAICLIFLCKPLIPNRTELLESLGDTRREYLVELMVTAGCPLIGKTVEEGGLRGLPGLFLIEIDRSGDVISPVAPTDRIVENDRLVFTGVVSTIVDLEKIKGLVPAADINYEIHSGVQARRTLVEVVLSPSSPLVGRTIRQANFRQLYNAAVIAVHRNGKRMPSKIGDIELSAGDTLLLQSQKGFVQNFKNRPDFYLVSGVEESDSRRHEKFGLAILITLGLIVWLFLSRPFAPPYLEKIYGVAEGGAVPDVFFSPAAAIFIAALLMILTRCLTASQARAAIDWPMLITIGAAIGVGRAIYDCGAGAKIAESLSLLGNADPYISLAIVFFVTVLLTEMISNVAVAMMMFYVALELAATLNGGLNPRPFIMAVTLGASLSFVSPIGYQTNLMVMGPGGYQSRDYVKVGLPLSILIGALAVFLIPKIWSFGL